METLNFEAFPLGGASIQQDMPTSQSVYCCLLETLLPLHWHCYTMFETRHCSEPGVCVYETFEHIGHRTQTYTNLYVKYPVPCSSVTNVCPSLQKTHTSSPVRHEHNTNLDTYFNRLAYQTLTVTHTNI